MRFKDSSHTGRLEIVQNNDYVLDSVHEDSGYK